MTYRHRDEQTGTSAFLPDGRVPSARVGNRPLRDIPEGQRAVAVYCHADPRHAALVAVLGTDGKLSVTNTGAAQAVPGATGTRTCRCPEGHQIGHARILAAADRLQGRPPKQRRVDVRSVELQR